MCHSLKWRHLSLCLMNFATHTCTRFQLLIKFFLVGSQPANCISGAIAQMVRLCKSIVPSITASAGRGGRSAGCVWKKSRRKRDKRKRRGKDKGKVGGTKKIRSFALYTTIQSGELTFLRPGHPYAFLGTECRRGGDAASMVALEGGQGLFIFSRAYICLIGVHICMCSCSTACRHRPSYAVLH